MTMIILLPDDDLILIILYQITGQGRKNFFYGFIFAVPFGPF